MLWHFGIFRHILKGDFNICSLFEKTDLGNHICYCSQAVVKRFFLSFPRLLNDEKLVLMPMRQWKKTTQKCFLTWQVLQNTPATNSCWYLMVKAIMGCCAMLPTVSGDKQECDWSAAEIKTWQQFFSEIRESYIACNHDRTDAPECRHTKTLKNGGRQLI